MSDKSEEFTIETFRTFNHLFDIMSEFQVDINWVT